MTKIHFELPKFKELYNRRIWSKGEKIYKAGDIYEAYAIDANHACCKVKGTIDYTVIITIEDDYLDVKCNCPYIGHCKHEVASLLYISKHPDLELVDKKPSQEISEVEEYKLYLSELEYDLDHQDFYDDDEFDDVDGSKTGEMAVEYIDDCQCSIATKIDMLLACDKYFGLDQDAWDLIVRLYKEDTAAVINQMTKNANDYSFVQSVVHIVEYVKENDLYIYEDIVKTLIKELSKTKFEELKNHILYIYKDIDVIETLFNNHKK